MKKNILVILPFLAFMFACQPEKVELPEFQAATDSTTYHVGETVTFRLSGNPDIISFYSGTAGNAYEFSATDRIVEALASVSFQTQNRSQSYTGIDAGASYCQDNQLKVKISTDFNGQYDSTSVKNATWVDLSNLFTIGPLACNSTSSYVPAGTVDLTNYLEDEKPFYFAFQYVNQPNKDFGNCNIWRFSNFNITAVSDAGSVVVATQNSALWSSVLIGGKWDPVRAYSTTTTAVTMRADPAYRDINQELWCISSALKVDKLINVGEDKAIGIKALADAPLTTYSYVFKKPGDYLVTFIAVNTSVYGRKETIKQIQLKIIP